MFKRKIYADLMEWYKNSDKKPLIIKGLRQVGKTRIVQQFAEENYKNVVYIDFRLNTSIRKVFEGDFDIDSLTRNMSIYLTDVKFIPYKTVIIFDEIQDCPNARSSLKYFKIDGRYDVICTGSLLGVKNYHSKIKNSRGVPVGYEDTLEMKAMDFEEFLWANGISKEITDYLRQCYDERKAPDKAIDFKIRELMKFYICVGGLPEVVKTFVETNNMDKVYNVQKRLINDYMDDFGVHIDEHGEKYIDETEKAKIMDVFKSIPSQLAKDNKKFIYADVQGIYKNEDYFKALLWLRDYGIIDISYNLECLELPLEGNKTPNNFKVYPTDIGLLVAMNEKGTQISIFEDDLYIYKGAIFEGLIADIFFKNNRPLYFYSKNSGLELDFVTRYKGKVTPIEVKATNGNAKSLKTVLTNKDKYHVDYAVKYTAKGFNFDKSVDTFPHYFAIFLKTF